MKLLIGGSPCTYWRPVVGYEDVYEVSKDGRIRNKKTLRELSPKKERNGYYRVHLSRCGETKSILLHRIVALSFIDNPHNYKTVNHIDEDKSNNSASNLEWCDMSYQNKYGVGAINRNRAKERAIYEVDKSGAIIRKFRSITEAADEYGLNKSSIGCVCAKKRRYKSTGGKRFVYADEGGGLA